MKKVIIPVLALVLITVGACNKKAFLNKLTGVWKIDRYIFDGRDKSLMFDTTYRNYALDLNEDNVYTINWQTYSFKQDSTILVDTLGYDSVNMDYIIEMDTFRFIDTTISNHTELGGWDLLNSDEDLQLRNDSSNAVSIFRILELTRSDLKLRKGNEEFYFKK